MNTLQFTIPLSGIPVSRLAPYSDDALFEPWQTYMDLQKLGSAVWLEKYEMFALTRYLISENGDVVELDRVATIPVSQDAGIGRARNKKKTLQKL